MNREIKFRAYNKPANGLKPGMFYDIGMGTEEQPLGINECIKRYTESDEWFLMQYTGLTDKNGTEIYEGDIVAICEDSFNEETEKDERVIISKHCIIWSTEGGYWEIDKLDSEYMGLGYNLLTLYDEDARYIEVIGNIFSNPELLEEKNV